MAEDPWPSGVRFGPDWGPLGSPLQELPSDRASVSFGRGDACTAQAVQPGAGPMPRSQGRPLEAPGTDAGRR